MNYQRYYIDTRTTPKTKQKQKRESTQRREKVVMRKIWKRNTAAVLAGLMVAGALQGCSSSGTEATKAENSTTAAQATTSGNSTENGKEKLVVALQTYSFITDYDDNYLTKRLEEELGIDIEFHLLSADSSEATTQLSLMISAGQELPDIICTNGALTKEAVLEYGSKGVLIPLADMLANPEIAPNFNTVVSAEDRETILEATTSADGNIYSMAQFEPQTWNMTPYRMFINQTWLDTLNLPMPTTTEEYYETLKAFATQDPNGNGAADEIAVYGISAGTYGENVTIPLMNSFIYYPGTKATEVVLTLDDSGDTVIAPFVQDNWRKGLEYMNRLCSEGLMPEAVFTDDKTQFMAVLNNEEVNLVGALSSGSLSRWNNYDANANGQEYEMLPPLTGPDGVAYAPFIQYQPTSVWYITSSCKNPELAVKLGDLFYDPEISKITRYGEPEVDWTTNAEALADPKYSNAYIEAGLCEGKSMLVLNDIWGQNNATFWRDINPRYATIEDSNTVVYATEWDPSVKSLKFYADNYNYYYTAHPDKLLPQLVYTNEEAQEQSEILVNVATYVSQSMAQFITGERPLTDKEWEAYKKELDTIGLSVWLENAQAAYDRIK